jgi:NTP pyrophosphatase (non-canonical NTP hydrolase)
VSAVAEELADAVIRLLHLAHHAGIANIGHVVLAKHTYNAGRPYRHGKRF